MSKARIRIAAGLAALAAAGAAAPGAHAITNGTLDGNDHPNVGMLAIEHDGFKQGRCTGFYAGTRNGDPGTGVFVTAAHCIDGLDAEGYSPTQLTVTFDGDATYDGEIFAATATTWHPAFAIDVADGADYGVVLLTDPVAVTPVRFPRLRLLDDIAAGASARHTTLFDMVGYGLVVTVNPTQFGVPGGRLFTTSRFLGLSKTRLKLLANERAGYGGACFGDSGSPVLMQGSDTVVAFPVGGDALCQAMNNALRLDVPAARAFYGRYLQLP